MIKRNMTTLRKLMLLNGAIGGIFSEDTAIGNPLTFITNVAKPLKSLLIPFTPQQEGTGDPSPQNIRSILPWNGLTVFGGGINQFDGQMELGTYNGNTGAKSSSSTRLRNVNPIKVKAGTYYRYVSNRQTDNGVSWLFYKKDGTFISNNNRASTIGGFGIAVPDDAYYMNISTWDNYGTVYENDIGINYPSTETAYEPYVPITDTDIVFPSPVYGGTLDVVSGVLTVEWRLRSMGGTSWDSFNRATSRAHPFFYGGFNDREKGRTTDFMADCFKKDTVNVFGSMFGTNAEDLSISFSADTNSTNVYIRDDSCSTREEFLQKYANRYVAYKLAEPQTVQLTPAQITALIGNNTIWSDAGGSMTATYLKKG